MYHIRVNTYSFSFNSSIWFNMFDSLCMIFLSSSSSFFFNFKNIRNFKLREYCVSFYLCSLDLALDLIKWPGCLIFFTYQDISFCLSHQNECVLGIQECYFPDFNYFNFLFFLFYKTNMSSKTNYFHKNSTNNVSYNPYWHVWISALYMNAYWLLISL